MRHLFDAQQGKHGDLLLDLQRPRRDCRGVSFGNFLLKRVVDDLKRDYPRLLRPLPPSRRCPSFRRAGLEKHPARTGSRTFDQRRPRTNQTPSAAADIAELEPSEAQPNSARRLLADSESDSQIVQALHDRLARALATRPDLASHARYLLATDKHGRPCDPVARFHLGNGARIERLNYLADTSTEAAWQQSYGLMVNYLYDP
jgi:malonyl-CoA decarboxylase